MNWIKRLMIRWLGIYEFIDDTSKYTTFVNLNTKALDVRQEVGDLCRRMALLEVTVLNKHQEFEKHLKAETAILQYQMDRRKEREKLIEYELCRIQDQIKELRKTVEKPSKEKKKK